MIPETKSNKETDEDEKKLQKNRISVSNKDSETINKMRKININKPQINKFCSNAIKTAKYTM